MRFLYNIGLRLYFFLVRLVSTFNPKAKLFYNGRRGLLKRIKKEVGHEQPIIWIHCSSVGEFEQARPVIEWYKKEQPGYKILLTFFSPSGYELRKNYELADWIYYMPVDTQKNARIFVETVKPEKAIFIKYEFWYNYLNELNRIGVQIFIVSAIFRPTQMFFKWYGSFFRRMLKCYTKIFVQDEQSRDLLRSIGIKDNVFISGDTRFDRVYQITHNSKEFPLIKRFSENHFTVVAGSTWEPDEAILLEVIKHFQNVKLILAPHEIHKERIDKLVKTLESSHKILKFSDFDKKFSCNKGSHGDILSVLDDALVKSDVLIIDCLGILSSIYRYGQLAYIGGGFGVGIHNILEAATYSMPVVFGPNYQKFKEARDLIELGGAVSVEAKEGLYDILDKYVNSAGARNEKGEICGNYVKKNLGATHKVTSNLF